MPVIGTTIDPETGQTIDVYDHPDNIPDDYVGTRVAVPVETVRPNEAYQGGVATMRLSSSSAPATGHPTIDMAPGAIPLIIPIVIALVLIVAALVILTLLQTSYAEHEYDYVKDGVECRLVVVQAGLAAPHYLDTCDNSWGEWGDGGIADILRYGAIALLVGMGGYLIIKYIAPAMAERKKRTSGG